MRQKGTREDFQEGRWRQILADGAERQALHSELDRRDFMAAFDHGVSEVGLTVELKPSLLRRQGVRCRAGLNREAAPQYIRAGS